MTRFLLTAPIAALFLAGCTPAGEEAADGVGEMARAMSLPADLGSPAYEETGENFTGRAVVDPQIAAFDAGLADRLMQVAQAALAEMKADAEQARAEADQQAADTGEESWFRPYEMEVRHQVTGQAGDFISIQQDLYLDSGGAHPNYFLGGAVYPRGEGAQVEISAIVADLAGFGAMLKDGLVEAKIERGYDEAARPQVRGEIDDLLGDDLGAGAEWGRNFVLNASSEAGVFGGITVLFSPYDVGPYAEGSYQVTIPAADLAGLLSEDWTGLFGGEPVLYAEGP